MPVWAVSPAPFGVDHAGGGGPRRGRAGLEARVAEQLASRCSRRREVLIVQVKEAEPEAPVVSLAVTVTLEVPAVVGVPVIRPRGVDRQAGRQAGGACRSGSGRTRSRSRGSAG